MYYGQIKLASTYYHGTGPTATKKILAEGLNFSSHGKGGGTLPGLDDSKKIWLTDNKSYADFYSRMGASSEHWERNRKDGLLKAMYRQLLQSHNKAAPVEVNVPDSRHIQHLGGPEYYSTKEIPAKYIKQSK